MPGRSFVGANGYRYGFNGQEKDDEVKGSGNNLDFTQRIYDPRLGKFFSIDPLTKKYPELTPYQFASNRPIDGIDMDGLEHVRYLYKIENGKAALIDVHNYNTDLRKGHGVEVVTVSNGEVINTFIPMNAPPKPNMEEKTNAPGLMSKLDSKMRGSPNNMWEMEGHSDGANSGYTNEQDMKVGLGMVGAITGLGGIAAASSALGYIGASLAFLNDADDVFAATNDQNESLSESLAKGKQNKAVVGVVKSIMTVITFSQGMSAMPEQVEDALHVVGTGADAAGVAKDLTAPAVPAKKK